MQFPRDVGTKKKLFYYSLLLEKKQNKTTSVVFRPTRSRPHHTSRVMAHRGRRELPACRPNVDSGGVLVFLVSRPILIVNKEQ